MKKLQNLLRELISFITAAQWCLALSWRASKLYTIFRISSEVISPIITITAAFVSKQLLDLLSGSRVVDNAHEAFYMM